MYIFLLILKIIGIIILSILGLLLVILAIVFFSPVSYSAKLEAADEICADGLVTYLHFIRAKATLRGTDFRLRVTLFKKELFSIGDDEDSKDEPMAPEASNSNKLNSKNDEALKNEEKPSKKEKADEPDVKDKAAYAEQKVKSDIAEKKVDLWADNIDELLDGEEAKTAHEISSSNLDENTNNKSINESATDEKSTDSYENSDSIKKSSKTSSLDDKADYEPKDKASETKKGLWDKISDLFEKLYGKLESLYHNLEEIWKIIEAGGKDVETFFKRKSTKFTIELLKTTLVKLGRHVKPQNLSGNLTVGMDDPAITGYICAVMGIIYDDYFETFEFTPDFTEKRLEGNANAKGRLLIGYITYLALNMYLKKQVRYCIKNIGVLKSSTLRRVDEIKSAVNL
jgi:hypothetical protein